jgi:hypothetical protein
LYRVPERRGLAQLEHDPIRVRLAHRELEVGAPDRAHALLGVRDPAPRALERVGEAIEAARADRGEDLALVREVAVRRGVAAAELLGQPAQGHGLVALLRERLHRDVAQALAEALDLLGPQAGSCHGRISNTDK